jgi:hypothetical protein
MMISQYCYFSLDSTQVTASEVTARLLVEPDEVTVRGSVRTQPKAIPVFHSWQVVCAAPGLTVTEQLGQIIERLSPIAHDIGCYVTELDERGLEMEARLQVVRNFDDEGGAEDDAADELVRGEVVRRLGGQHQLLGWHLDRSVLAFLQATGAELDVDEYG